MTSFSLHPIFEMHTLEGHCHATPGQMFFCIKMFKGPRFVSCKPQPPGNFSWSSPWSWWLLHHIYYCIIFIYLFIKSSLSRFCLGAVVFCASSYFTVNQGWFLFICLILLKSFAIFRPKKVFFLYILKSKQSWVPPWIQRPWQL